MTKLADRRYPDEVTITLSRKSAMKMHFLVGTRPLSDLLAREVHNALVANLDKTVDDLQHEKLEAATRAAQEKALGYYTNHLGYRVPLSEAADRVDGNDPDDIARALYEWMRQEPVPVTPARRLLFCRQIVAVVRHHLPEENTKPAEGKVIVEMWRTRVVWLKRLLAQRNHDLGYVPFTTAIIRDLQRALDDEVGDDGR